MRLHRQRPVFPASMSPFASPQRSFTAPPWRCPISPLAARMSLNTQHIVAAETGVTDVVDPLAGSYYVEYLTNQVEQEAYGIWNKIEELGGMSAAIQRGYIQEMLTEEIQS